MCGACELKDCEKVIFLSHEKTESNATIEKVLGAYRFHLSVREGDIVYHNTRDFYFCPFCGRNLKEGAE